MTRNVFHLGPGQVLFLIGLVLFVGAAIKASHELSVRP